MTGEALLERFVEANDGTRLYVESQRHAGSDLVAVLCDGILCDGFVWKYLWPSVATRMSVAHWHYRGHGRSAAPRDVERIDVRAHADDLRRVRESLGNPKVVLFGHSMGCQVALEGFHLAPDRVAGLVLIAGSYGKITETFKGTRLLADWLPRVIDPVMRHAGVVRALWSRLPSDLIAELAIRFGEVDPTVRKEDLVPYMRGLSQLDVALLLRMLRAAGEHTAEPYLHSVSCPVLVIAGKRDSFTPPYLAEELAKRLPNAELFLVDATHVPPLEQPEVINLRIDKFLREHVL